MVVVAAQAQGTGSIPRPHIKTKMGVIARDGIVCNPSTGEGEDIWIPGLPVSLPSLLASSRPTGEPDH